MHLGIFEGSWGIWGLLGGSWGTSCRNLGGDLGWILGGEGQEMGSQKKPGLLPGTRFTHSCVMFLLYTAMLTMPSSSSCCSLLPCSPWELPLLAAWWLPVSDSTGCMLL